MKSRWIQPDGSEEIHHLDHDPTLTQMQEFVGGNVDIIQVLYLGKPCHMVVHDEGMLIPLPKNLVATEIYYTASRARGVEPTDRKASQADSDAQIAGFAASLGIAPENIVSLDLGNDMENCIYGPAIVLEGKLE